MGLSLGSSDPLDARHLAALAALAARFEPAWVSEHLSWSSVGGRHAHELLPLPHTPQAAAHVAARIARVQDLLRREILVENVSAYLRMPGGTMPEWDFVAEVQRRSGCRLLLDVNNVWVNASHHGFDPRAYLEALAPGSVGEIHLGGYEDAPEGLVDTHGAAVSEPVWALYEAALARFGPVPTLIEWDQGLPPLEVLLAEAARAARLAGASEAQAA